MITDEIINNIINDIKNMDIDTKFTFRDFLIKYSINDQFGFELIDIILNECNNQDIKLKNNNEGMIVGMPYDNEYEKL